MKPLLFTCIALLIALPAQAAERFLDIQKMTTPGGIEIWYVNDDTLPVLALAFQFRGAGTTLDPEGQQGLVQLLSNTMDEGAGERDAQAFQKALNDNSISLRFSASRDAFGGLLKTLADREELAFSLLEDALTAPRFAPEAVERMRAANLARLRSASSDPDWMAARLFNDRAFAGSAYARNSGGTLSGLAAVTPADLKRFQETELTRDRLLVAAAGRIEPQRLATLVDRTFGALPKSAPETDAQAAQIALQNQGTAALYDLQIPQTVIEMALPGLPPQDPDYPALLVLNHLYGGAGFGSRLMEEVREKRGLTYGIYSSLSDMERVQLIRIATSTENANVPEVLALVRSVMADMAAAPPEDGALADAKAYLTGSLPLALTSTEALAGIVLSLRVRSLPIDWLDGYAARIRAVEAADVQSLAARLLDPARATLVMVGRPAAQDFYETETVKELPNVR